MALLPPNLSLANGETVTVIKQVSSVSVRGGVGQSDGSSATYPGFITERTLQRTDANGAPISVTVYSAMIFTAADPGVVTDDTLQPSAGQTCKALGPSYPRGPGCWKVDLQLVS